MAALQPSALITDQGRYIFLRIRGRQFQLNQEELRTALGLPPGPPGVGITVDRNHFQFEFPADSQSIELSAEKLYRRLATQKMAAPLGRRND
jgi:hypothetical protein